VIPLQPAEQSPEEVKQPANIHEINKQLTNSQAMLAETAL
jgi:hypothetical protein